MPINPHDILIANKLKQTRPRLLVLEQLLERDVAISQPDLEKKLGSEVDRVTLYRTLTAFEEKGIVHKVIDTNGTANFAMCQSGCSPDHHHDEHLHFHCNQCKTVYCLDIKIPDTTIPDGFTMDSIQLMATGICKTCNSQQ